MEQVNKVPRTKVLQKIKAKIQPILISHKQTLYKVSKHTTSPYDKISQKGSRPVP